jgi:hypothetical protein
VLRQGKRQEVELIPAEPGLGKQLQGDVAGQGGSHQRDGQERR